MARGRENFSKPNTLTKLGLSRMPSPSAGNEKSRPMPESYAWKRRPGKIDLFAELNDSVLKRVDPER
jgi:hypothetical protein